MNHGLESDVKRSVPLKDGKIKMKTSDQDECVLCCREISIYAVGVCDHPVCYICSARMRVLCETNECPICRSDMPMVICTLKKKPFLEISKKFSLIDRKFQITFQNSEIQESFQLLLENKCKNCDAVFLIFNKLRDHVRREHGLQYCELCAENLKLFPFERKIYDRKELARHKRIGDPDQTSHRGHPLCEFCDQRYVDSDELFRHLRREHYFCHFCDADGKNQFYEDYNYLRVHFRKDHYLCEEGDCANEQFTGAFRTDIDLKAHIATHHSKNKSKAEARQARTLDIDFTYIPHNRSNVNSSPRGNRYHKRQNAEGSNSRENSSNQQVETEKIDTQSTLEFPYLSEDGESNNAIPKSNLSSMTLQSFNRNTVSQRQKEPISFDDFPALVSTTVSVTSEGTNNQSRKFNISFQRQQNNILGKAPNLSVHLTQKNVSRTSESDNREIDSKKQVPTWISKRSTTNFEDEFPTLETKKPPVTYTNIVNTTIVNNVQSKPQPTVENISTSQSGDQFLYIKSKSRKKKNKTACEDKATENADDTGEKKMSSASYHSLLNNNSSLLSEQNADEKFKKNLLRPSPKTNFVEEDMWQRKVTFGKDDFPPLAPSEPLRKLPSFGSKVKKPPPGFNVSSNNCSISAPLNISLSSIARQLVSPGVENKNLDTAIRESDFTYKTPLNFEKRNADLKNKINPLVFNDFKTKSGEFRQNKITPITYYTECLKMLGEKDFIDIFPELICLLPDINKQQELYNVYKKHQNNYGAVSKHKLENNKLTVCDICYQVLMEFDYRSHISQHEEQN